MRDNPDNDTLRNLIGREANKASDPKIPPQSEIAQVRRQIDINEVVDKLTSDAKGERDNQLSDDDYEETTRQSQQQHQLERPHFERPRRVTIPMWRVKQNQLDVEELPKSPTADLIALTLNLTNAVEQLQAPQSI